jgi:hypothetical protein
VVDELKQILRRENGHVRGGPGRFGAARRGADQSFAKSIGTDRSWKGSGNRGNRAIERQFAEHQEAFDRITSDRAGCRHQPEHDGKVVMAAFFRQIGGSKIDGDPLRREREPDGIECAAHLLSALGHGLVGEADNGKGGKPGPICTWTSTARASMPSNATVVPRANMA